jgi:hypothetical protein
MGLLKSFGHVSPRANILNGQDYPGANTAAVITLAAAARVKHVVHNVQWSYSAAPTGGRLTITVNAITKFDVHIIEGGPGGFSLALAGEANQAIVLTLAAGGGGIIGFLNVQYTSETTSRK